MIEIQPLGLAAELEALAGAPTVPKGPQCTVGAFLAQADEPTAAALRAALDTPGITGKAIADTLRRYESDVTAYTVARHRRRGESNGCRCPR
ncbi:hypothetical protein AB0O57_29345 [Streptomyces sp. NPDC091201]|uniref:hypothetical protein n=1 Tax=Streptomyces sp. NPDC091201 TaxID=3155190 RepID=UPI003443FB3D